METTCEASGSSQTNVVPRMGHAKCSTVKLFTQDCSRSLHQLLRRKGLVIIALETTLALPHSIAVACSLHKIPRTRALDGSMPCAAYHRGTHEAEMMRKSQPSPRRLELLDECFIPSSCHPFFLRR